MKLQQLRFFCEVAQSGFSISAAASTLFTSQPGISRQIGMLESELGVKLLVRRGNRILGLTDAGTQILAIATRVLDATEAMRRVAKDFSLPATGTLTVATTHTHARFTLAEVIGAFSKAFPNVDVRIMLGLPNQIAAWVSSGEADVGFSTRPATGLPGVALVRWDDVGHSLVAHESHPVLQHRRVTLENIVRYPIIAYDDSNEISRLLSEKFRAAGLSPRIVMRASDSDVIKTYVAAGLGIAVIATVAFAPKVDTSLRAVDMAALVKPTIAYAVVRTTMPMRKYVYDFLRMVSPRLAKSKIEAAIGVSLDSGNGRGSQTSGA